MLPTLKRAIDRNKVPFFKTAKNVQDAIPVKNIYADGIFEHDKSVFSASYSFKDINYEVLSKDEKMGVFKGYCDLIVNQMPKGATTKITINNRAMDLSDIKKDICLKMRGDKYDEYRAEYNQMLVEAVSKRSALVQEKYITVSINKPTYEDAVEYFKGVTAQLNKCFTGIKSTCRQLSTAERLSIIHDFYRDGNEGVFDFNFAMATGNKDAFKAYVSPDYLDLNDYTYARLGNERFCRVMNVKSEIGLPNKLTDAFLNELTKVDKQIVVSLDCVPIPVGEALSDTDQRLLGQETNITRWQSRMNKDFQFSATVPPKYGDAQANLRDVLSYIKEYDQKEYQVVITIGILAKSKTELDRLTKSVVSICEGHSVQIMTSAWEQLQGMQTVLPIGVCRIPVYNTLLTEGVGIFVPFRIENMFHRDGVYYGQNEESGAIIRINKFRYQNTNSMIFGVTGSGKSFTAKMEMIANILRGDCDVIVVDPQGEYGRLFEALGGEIIKLAPNSSTTLNLLDINEDYAEEGGTPIALKTDFMIAFCQQACDGILIGPKHKSLIVRVTEAIYREYINNGYQGECPTLYNFIDTMRQQPEIEAQDISLALEVFTSNSFSMFAQPTNVDTQNHVLCYDISALGNQLKSVGMLTMLDAIFNRVTSNFKEGRVTYIFFDEFHLLTKYPFTADYLAILWRTLRKFGGSCTGITQNITEMEKSETASSIVSNSEFIIMLRQQGEDKDSLVRLLRFSRDMLKYVTNSQEGHGMIKLGDSVIPFSNDFPTNTALYKLMTTKVTDRIAYGKEEKAKAEAEANAKSDTNAEDKE